MIVDRREFIKKTGVGLASLFIIPHYTSITKLESSTDSMGMLFDSTLCIGCRQCEINCKNLRSNPQGSLLGVGEDEIDNDLTARTWTIIKLYQDKENRTIYSFVKKNCMHCIDPACVSACPVGALQKTEYGPVIYDEKICIGCRYCMAACPFEIPKYEWERVFPRIQKCDFCAERQQEGLLPACVEACRIGALKFGKRSELLAEAKERIKNDPANYINHIYGENEIGGSSQLYLSKVPFEKLGLPVLNSSTLPSLTWPWMKSVPGVAVVVGMLMAFLYWFTGRSINNVELEESNDRSHA